MNKQVQWEDPPSRRWGRKAQYAWFYDALKANPGRWARYPGNVQGTSIASYRSRFSDFEWVVRTVDGESRVFVRYCPEEVL